MSESSIARNAGFAVVQVVVSAAMLLVTYRLLMEHLAIEEIGLWALILGSASLARLTEMGFGAGVLRHVAADLAHDRGQMAARTVGMAAGAVTLLCGCAALVAWPIVTIYLQAATPAAMVPVACWLLVAALVSVTLGGVSNVFLSAIDGCQRMDLRAIAQLASSAVQLVLTWLVVARYGLTGLGWVQIGQALFQFALGLGLAAWLLRQPVRAWFGFDRQRFKALVSYGGVMQVSAIAQMFYEPLIKVMLTSFSGLALTGYFDLANRILLQFRSVLVTGYNALVPHVAREASAGRLDPARIAALYRRSFAMLLAVLLPYAACLAAGLPLALTLWKGYFDAVFLAVALVQWASWMINTVTPPSYLIYIALGRLRWTVLTHLAVGLLTLVFGLSLGVIWGGPGVLAGGLIGQALGSLVCVTAFHREYGARWLEQVNWPNLAGLALAAAAALTATMFAMGKIDPGTVALVTIPLAFVTAATVLAWTNPLRRNLLKQVQSFRRY